MDNRLTFLKRDSKNPRKSWYLCRCGKVKSIRTDKVKNNLVRSCGCYSAELAAARLRNKPGRNSLPVGVSGCNMLFAEYKRSAKRKSLVFELDREYFQKVTSSACHYCGKPPSKMVCQRGSLHLAYMCNGIDRVNSEVGYIVSNCVAACSDCNFAKRQMTSEQYLDHCKSVVLHNKLLDK